MGAHAAVAAVPDPEPAAAESGPVLTYHGEQFRVHPEGVSEFAQLELAEMITSGSAESNYQDQAAILRLVIDGVHEDDRLRFRAACRQHRATIDELLELITAGTVGTQRPTEAPSDSSAGRIDTELKSGSSSDVKASTAFPGRPDLQLIEAKMLEQQAV